VDLQKQNCTNKIGTDKILLLLCAAYPESSIDEEVCTCQCVMGEEYIIREGLDGRDPRE
jgi:hypothetical protein